MNRIARLALLAGLPLMLAGTAAAQTTGTTTGTTTSPTSNTGGTGGLGNSGGNSGFQGQTMEGAPVINTGTATGANVNGSNAFASYYANPQYPGRAGSLGNDNPGGFGTALSSGTGGAARNSGASPTSRTSNTGYGNTRTTGGTSSRTGTTNTTGGMLTSSTISSTGAVSQTRATGGTTGGFGGATAGGFGGTTTGQGGRSAGGFGQQTGAFGGQGGRTTGGFGQQSGMFGTGQQNTSIIAQQSRPVSYTLNLAPSLRPQPPAIPAMHAELNGAIARSSVLSNPRGITANYDGKYVILRGAVKDEEEARTAEGIVRLTPGVRGVKNELTYPQPTRNP